MAGPGGKEVGRVSIRVLPDTSQFGTSLKKYLERTEQRLRLNLPVSLDQSDVAQVETELEALARDRTINVDVDTKEFTKNIASATSAGSRGFGRMAALVGAVSLAVAALAESLPGFLAVLGAPIAAIIVGFDGIKNAAKSLSDEVEHLQKVVSATFEKGLGSGFEDLAKVFPTLEDGLSGIAESVSAIFGQFAQAISGPGGLSQLASIFENVKGFLDGIAPAVQPFVHALLTLADFGARVAAAMTPQLVKTFQDFDNVISDMAANGDLQKSLEGIGHSLVLVVDLISKFVLGVVIAHAWAERFGEFISKAAGKIRSAVRATIGYVRSLPALIQAAFSTAGTILVDVGSAIVDGLLQGLVGAWHKVTDWVSNAISGLSAAAKALLGIASPSKVFREIGGFIGEGLALGIADSMTGVEASATALVNAPIRATTVARLTPASEPATKSGPVLVHVVNVDQFDDRSAVVASSVVNDQSAFAGTMDRMNR